MAAQSMYYISLSSRCGIYLLTTALSVGCLFQTVFYMHIYYLGQRKCSAYSRVDLYEEILLEIFKHMAA